MKSRLAGSALWLTAAILLPAMLLLLPQVTEAAAKSSAKGKAAAKPAKSSGKAAPASSGKSSSGSASESKPSAPYEVPTPASPEGSPSPSDTSKPAEPPSSSSASSVTSSSTSTSSTSSSSSPSSSSSSSADPLKDAPAAVSEPAAAPEIQAPLIEEPAAPAEPLPVYVEHLGPSSYPGKMRGLYGGSMWLEPSFHGLQWPYMAKSGVGVSGSFWVDSGWETIKRDPTTPVADTTMFLQQGRALLRVTPTYVSPSGKFFVQSQVELVGNLCQASSPVCQQSGTVDTDDLWIRFGQWNVWDVKVGRFEAWELYHTGMGLDINTQERLGAQNAGVTQPADLVPPNFYTMDWMHRRPTEGLGVGYLAFHAYPMHNLRFEMLGELGASDVQSLGYTYLGGRPSMILDQGWMKLKLGAEYEKRWGDATHQENGEKSESKAWRVRKGFGGGVQFVIDPYAEFGGNFAFGWQESHENFETGDLKPLDSFSRNSVGGFANLRLGTLWLVGGGANFTWQNDKFYYQNAASPNYTAHLQIFASIQYYLARQLMIKAVIGYARADFIPSDESIDLWSNVMYSARVRLMYLY
jgi:hypothetical protein